MDDAQVASTYLSPAEIEIKNRLVAGYTHWIENPTTPDSKVVTFLKETFSISQRQHMQCRCNQAYFRKCKERQ